MFNLAYGTAILLSWQAICVALLILGTFGPVRLTEEGPADAVLSVERLTWPFAVSGLLVVFVCYFSLAPWLERRRSRRRV